jgi:hypothetical protein
MVIELATLHIAAVVQEVKVEEKISDDLRKKVKREMLT